MFMSTISENFDFLHHPFLFVDESVQHRLLVIGGINQQHPAGSSRELDE